MAYIQTLLGQVPVESLGIVLPHEHLFVDLRGPLAAGYAQAEPEAVVRLMLPYLEAARAHGVTLMVDCAPVGVGRNIAALRRLAESTPIHIVAPTGRYREGLMLPDQIDLDDEALAMLWIQELTEGIEGTDYRAGFIKVALNDDGPRSLEIVSLQAAALASRATGAVVGSHTIGGKAARRELDLLEAAGHDPRRFIWIHAHTEPDTAVHIEAAKRGAWLEFDAIGAENWHPQPALLAAVLALLEAGYADQLLLSHDAGWYDPAQPDGVPKPDGVRGYTALFEQFIPALRAHGVDEATIRQMIVTNPARAFAISEG